MTKKLVAQTFSTTCPFYQSGDVDKLHGCRQDILWIDDIREIIKTGVWNCDDADIWFNGTEGVISGLSTGRGYRVEDG
jgi:hypothetical protein